MVATAVCTCIVPVNYLILKKEKDKMLLKNRIVYNSDATLFSDYLFMLL